MTEDDTYRVLRRDPFEVVFKEAPWMTSDPINEDHWKEFLEPYGWTHKEFLNELRKRYI